MVAATIWGLTAEIAPSCPQPQAPLVPVSQLPLEATRGAHELEAEPATRPRRDPQAGERAGGEGLTARAGEQILSQGEADYTTGLSRRVSGMPARAPGHLGLLCPGTRTKHRSRGPDLPGRRLGSSHEARSREQLSVWADGEIKRWGGGRCFRRGWEPTTHRRGPRPPLIGQDTAGSVCGPVLATPMTQHRRARLLSRLRPGSLGCGRGVGLRGTRAACSCLAASAASLQGETSFPLSLCGSWTGKAHGTQRAGVLRPGPGPEGERPPRDRRSPCAAQTVFPQQGEAAAADSADTKSRRTLEEGVSRQVNSTSVTLVCGKSSSRGAEGGPWRGAWCRLACISRSPLPTTSCGVGRGSGDVGRVAGVSFRRRPRWWPTLPVLRGRSENHAVGWALLPPLPVVGRGGPG